MHNTPVIFDNKTTLENEVNFYSVMKKTTILHVAGSTLASAVVVTTTAPVIFLTIPMGWLFYHGRIFYESSHMEQKCLFYIDETQHFDKFENSFSTKWWWWHWNNLPEFFFNPILFCVICYLFIFVFVTKYGFSIKLLWGLLIFFYTYSFLQEVKLSTNVLNIRKEIKKTELRNKCHIYRISFAKRVKIWAKSLFSTTTDKYGYIINEECKGLEVELYMIDESYIVILYKTFTKSLVAIIKELFFSLGILDKILIFGFFILLYFVLKTCKGRFWEGKFNKLEIEGEGDGEIEITFNKEN